MSGERSIILIPLPLSLPPFSLPLDSGWRNERWSDEVHWKEHTKHGRHSHPVHWRGHLPQSNEPRFSQELSKGEV